MRLLPDKHDSEDGEILAMRWHWAGLIVSSISTFLTGAGIYWHYWAVKEHKKTLDELRRGN